MVMRKKIIVMALTCCVLLSGYGVYRKLTCPTDPTLLYSFNAGELSPLVKYRIDQEQYSFGSQKVENLIVLPQGAAVRRPGTKYIAEANDPNVKIRLIPFEASN